MSDNINKQQFYNVIKVIEQSSEQELDAIVNVEKAIAKQVTAPTVKRINPRSGVAAGGGGDFDSMPMSAVAPAAPMGDFTRPIKNDDGDERVKQAERAATSINNATNNTTNNASSNTVNQREEHNSALSSKLIAQSITESVSSATEQSANKVNATANSTINNNESKADNNKSASNPSVSNVDNSSNIKAEQNKQVQHNKSTQVSQNQTNDLLEGLYEDSQGRLRQASGAFASRQQRELHNSSNSNDTAEESTQPSILKALSNWVTGNTISSDNQAVDSAGVAVGSSVWMAAKEVSNVVGDAKNFAIDNNLTTKEGIAGKLESAKSVVSDPKAAFKNYFSSRQDSNIDSNVEGESQVSTSTSAGGDPAPVTTATTTNSESSANVVAPNVTNSVSSLENNAENMPSVSNSDTNNSTNSSANSTNNVPAPVTATTTNSESNANVIVPNVTNSVSSLENNAGNTPSVSNSTTNATNNAPAPVTTTNSESNASVIAPNVTSSISNLESNAGNTPSVSNSDTSNSTNSNANSTNNVPATITTTNSESNANVVAPNVTNSVSSLENNAGNTPSVSNSATSNSTNNAPAPVTATTTNSESNASVIAPNVTNSVSNLENNAENMPSVSNSDTSNSTNSSANSTNNAPAPVTTATTSNSESNANVITPNVTNSVSNLENNTPGSLTSNTNVSDSAAARRKENQGPESAVLIDEQTKLQSIENKQQLELLDKINTSVAASGGSSGGGLFGDDGIDLDRKKKGRKKKGHRGRPKRGAMGRMTSVLSTGGEKAASLMTGAKAAGTGLAATGGAGMLAKGASKFVPFLAPLLAAYDGVQGFNDTEKQKEVFNLKEDQAATTGQKSSMALASVLDMGGLVSGGAGLLGGLLGSMGFEGAQQAMSFDSSDMTKGIYSMFGGDSTENTESQTTTSSAPVNTELTTGPVSTEPPATVSNDTEIVTTSVLGTAAPSIPAATLSGTKVEQSLTPGIDVTKTSLEKQAQREQNAIASEEQETLPGNSNNSAVMSTSITSSDVGDDLTLKSTDNTTNSTNSTEGNQSSSRSTDNQVPVLLNPASKSKDTSTAITESLQSIVNNAGTVLPGSVSSHSSNDDSKLTTQSTLDVPAAMSPALKSSQANPSLTTAVDTTNSNASSMTSTSNASFNVDGTKPDVSAPGNTTNNSETNQATSSSTDIKANEPSLIKSIVERVKSTMSIKPKSTSSNSSSNTNTDTLNKLLVDADTTESTQVSAESTSNNANNTTNTPVSAISNSTQGNTSVSSNTAFERTSSRLANTNKSLTTAQYANSMPERPGESPTSITPNNKSSKKKKNEPIVVVAKSDPALTKAMTELVKISKDNKTNGKGSSVTSSNKSTTNITSMNKSGDSGIPIGLSDAQLQLIAIDAR